MNGSVVQARRSTRAIRVGPVAVGGSAAVSVQTMTKTDTRDVAATVAQIRAIADAGCDIVRLAVVDMAAAQALAAIRRESPLPLIADIHFDYRLALAAVAAGVDGLRINPGNIGGEENVRAVARACADKGIPIRIGVNSGSLDRDLVERYGARSPEALAESALRQVATLDGMGFTAVKISVKASDVARTVAAYRLLAQRTDCPLHLGVTEAGTRRAGTVRSAVALGILLAEGIGDTIRVSLTDDPVEEVRVGLEILRSLGLREPGPSVTSCPTCGRVEVDVGAIATEVERRLEILYRLYPGAHKPHVAVMGCMVNGPGEARDADVALAGGKGRFAVYQGGAHVRSIPEGEAVEALVGAVEAWLLQHPVSH